MSSFTKHNVHYLSPSMINTFVECPAIIMLKIMGIEDGEAGPSAWRGIAVEDSITQLAYDPDVGITHLTESADKKFVKLTQEAVEDHSLEKIEKERKDVPSFIKSAYPFYKNLGTPISHQKRIELNLPMFDIPIIGYYDLEYDDCVRDVKTGYARSGVSRGHARQLSIYGYALGKPPFVDYVSKTKVSSYEVRAIDRNITEFIRIAKTLENILSISDDIRECCQFIPFPNIEHWMFGTTTREAVRSIWG